MRLAPYRSTNRVVLDGLEPDFADRLYALLTDPRLQHRVTIVSAVRTRAQQQDLYDRWRAGTYNVKVVARPGTSRHETGRAADLDIHAAPFGWSLVHQVAAEYGLHFPVRGEAWHVETKPGAAPLEEPMLTETQERMLKDLHAWMSLQPKTALAAAGDGINTLGQVVGKVQDSEKRIVAVLPNPAALAAAIAPQLAAALSHDGPVELSVIEAAVTRALSKARFKAE